ncbi:uncharacterized protein LOC8035350 [Ixodes scapularis]|uniref:uncharacterized protein LOC8035350 n=1 Tax=Ixodes scapularis TaxID=6945 RepID=UPI001A9E585B|nr:uncharacterized protein LOC8035350 [Ixodes scapularis]
MLYHPPKPSTTGAAEVPSIIQQVATGPVGGGLVPDWARPSALLQSIVDRLRGSSLPCESPTGQEGACMLHFNCASVSGVTVPSPDCPQSAVCCRLPEEAATTVSCGGTITGNNTNFRNPDFPSEFRREGMCSAEVTFGREVCQLRLEFLHFSIAGPRASGPRVGLCDDDVFAVATGIGNLPYPALCGYNGGQHMYIDVSEATRAVLTFSIGGEVTVARKWNVRVSTVHCLSNMKAPESCLQYHTEPAGEFSSFNYRPSATSQQMIAGLKYSVCFKKQLGFCQISYTASEPGSFQVGPSNRPLVGARNCENAYVFIPSGSNKNFLDDVTADRFCGSGLAGDIIASEVGPFTLGVLTARPLGASSGVGAILGREPARGPRGFPHVDDDNTTTTTIIGVAANATESEYPSTTPDYLLSNATGTYAVFLNSTEAFREGELSMTPLYFKTNSSGTYAVFENTTATYGDGDVTTTTPASNSIYAVFLNSTEAFREGDLSTMPVYFKTNASGTYAVFENATEVYGDDVTAATPSSSAHTVFLDTVVDFREGDLSTTPVYLMTNASGTYAVFEEITVATITADDSTTPETLSGRHGSFVERPVQMMKPVHVKTDPHTGAVQTPGEAGFVKGQFSMVKPAHHTMTKPMKGGTLINVVERPDLSSGAGFAEQPENVVVSDPRNIFNGGFKMRYMMTHC